MKPSRIPFYFKLLLVCCIFPFSDLEAMVQTYSWEGTPKAFDVSGDRLQSTFDLAQTEAYIATQQSISGLCEWDIHVKLNFNPSSNNLCRIYLSTDVKNPTAYKGYYLLVGGTKDEISLFRKEGEAETLIIEGEAKRIDLKKVELDIKLTKDTDGNWSLFTQLADEYNFRLEGSSNDKTFTHFSWFGIYCKYTKTRATGFTFSNIQIHGEKYTDSTPPSLVKVQATAPKELSIQFNEMVNTDAATFSIVEPKMDASSVFTKDNLVRLSFDSAFIEDQPTFITIRGVNDTLGNEMEASLYSFTYTPFRIDKAFATNKNTAYVQFSTPTDKSALDDAAVMTANDLTHIEALNETTFLLEWAKTFATDIPFPLVFNKLLSADSMPLQNPQTDIVYHPIKIGDVVLNEVMADPTPSVGLPEVEFIEIRNNSEYDISLFDLSLVVNGKPYVIQKHEQLLANSLCFFVSSNFAEGFNQPNSVSLQIMPHLSNMGFELWLENTNGKMLDYLSYKQSLFKSEFKSDGGWSMERIDAYNLNDQNNWEECTSKLGGTPGMENSVARTNPDLAAPNFRGFYLRSSHVVEIYFSESITLPLAENLTFENAEIKTNEIRLSSPGRHTLVAQLSKELEAEHIYHIQLSDIADLSGNKLNTIRFDLRLPETPEFNDMVINELHPTPLSNHPEFVELYNRSSKFIDVSQCILTKRNNDGELKTGSLLCDSPFIMPSKSYLVLSKDIEGLQNAYDLMPHQLLAIKNMPTLANEQDDVVLALRNGTLIDEVRYNKDWHYSLLGNTQGVSLERTDAFGVSNDANNWSSASSVSGFASPGKINSHASMGNENTERITLASEYFTPDNDGYLDLLEIDFPEVFDGYSAKVSIINEQGKVVAIPMTNVLLGTNSKLFWDAIGTNKAKVPSGIYIAYIEMLTPDGRQHTEKIPFTVTFTNR